MKEKKSSYEKTKLFLTIEYLVISLILIVLAVLKLTGILSSDNFVKSAIFNIVTLLGGTWLLTDFIWASVSRIRRARIAYLDKCIMLPLGIYLMTFDIISLINWNKELYFDITQVNWYKVGVSIALLYIAVAYIFLGIYHHFNPTPDMLKLKAELEAEEKEKSLIEKEENKDGQNDA